MALWIIAAVSAFFVKGLCGFANTLVFTTALSFGTANREISPVELLLGYPTNVILAWRERAAINWRMCLPLMALVIAGSIPGALLLRNADTGAIKIAFGVLIVLIGGEMLLREFRSKRGRMSRAMLATVGVLSGVLCGLYGVGALLGAYISRVTDDSHAFKANICMVFIAENTFRIVTYALWGIITLESLKLALVLMPGDACRAGTGHGCSKVLSERVVRRVVVVMLIVSGVALIATSL